VDHGIVGNVDLKIGRKKSEAIACASRCPVNKVVDPKKDNWKKGGPRRRKGTRGR
jgi:hypothetical protein